jgi:hypothetical protein
MNIGHNKGHFQDKYYLLETEIQPELHFKTHLVPRSKHTPSRL